MCLFALGYPDYIDCIYVTSLIYNPLTEKAFQRVCLFLYLDVHLIAWFECDVINRQPFDRRCFYTQQVIQRLCLFLHLMGVAAQFFFKRRRHRNASAKEPQEAECFQFPTLSRVVAVKLKLNGYTVIYYMLLQNFVLNRSNAKSYSFVPKQRGKSNKLDLLLFSSIERSFWTSFVVSFDHKNVMQDVVVRLQTLFLMGWIHRAV